VIRIVCAITIAVGVKRMPHDRAGPRATAAGRRRADDDRRQAHQRVEDDDQRAPAAELVHGDAAPSGSPIRRQARRGDAHAKAQPTISDELRVEGGDEPPCLHRCVETLFKAARARIGCR
jgi:hypothetical protein